MLAAVLACAAVLLVAGSAPVDAANKKDFSGLVGAWRGPQDIHAVRWHRLSYGRTHRREG